MFNPSAPAGSWFTPTGSSGSAASQAELAAAFREAYNQNADEAARQFELDYDLKKRQIDQTYKAAMMNARTQADVAQANARYQQQQYALAKEQLSFDREKFGLTFPEQVRQYNATLAENQRQFDATNALSQARLGYDVLNMGAQLRGPSNYFQAANLARGTAGNPQTSTFLSALQNNNRLAGFGAQAGLPDKETLGTLGAKLTGGAGSNDQHYLAQIGNIAAKGAHQLGAGSLEQLTPTEYGLFTSGLDELGVDKDTFLDAYRRSRIGQGYGATGGA